MKNRADPLVGISLICIPDGMPLAFAVYPGKKSEQTVLSEFIKKIRELFGLESFTIVADRGLYTGRVIATVDGPLSDGEKDEYILGMSVRKESNELKEWIIDPDSYDQVPIYRDGLQVVSLVYKYRVEKKSSASGIRMKKKEASGRIREFWSTVQNPTQEEKRSEGISPSRFRAVKSARSLKTRIRLSSRSVILTAEQVRQLMK